MSIDQYLREKYKVDMVEELDRAIISEILVLAKNGDRMSRLIMKELNIRGLD